MMQESSVPNSFSQFSCAYSEDIIKVKDIEESI